MTGKRIGENPRISSKLRHKKVTTAWNPYRHAVLQKTQKTEQTKTLHRQT